MIPSISTAGNAPPAGCQRVRRLFAARAVLLVLRPERVLGVFFFAKATLFATLTRVLPAPAFGRALWVLAGWVGRPCSVVRALLAATRERALDWAGATTTVFWATGSARATATGSGA